MIIKFFEREKISKTGLDFYLIYGDNEGQKKEILDLFGYKELMLL